MTKRLTQEEKNFNKFIKFLQTQVPAEKFNMTESNLYGIAQSRVKVTKENLHVCNTAACIYGWGYIHLAIEKKLDIAICDVLEQNLTVRDLGKYLGLDETQFYGLCYCGAYSNWATITLATAIDCLKALQAWTKANQAGQQQLPYKNIAQEIINAAHPKEASY